MNSKDIRGQRLSNTPGVYVFRGAKTTPLYIGRATSLRSRVRSYFDKDISEKRGSHIALMVERAKSVEVIKTDSVLEAIILEGALIKKYKPRFNTKEKDDKSFNYVVITKEDFPRLLLVRGMELFRRQTLGYVVKYVFGPFPHGGVLKEALQLVRKIFPYRYKCLPNAGKPCFDRQIGLCPGVCSGEVSKSEYARRVSHLKLFFEGKKNVLLKKLEREMNVAARMLEFERATEIKKTIFALKHIRDVALIKNDINTRDYVRIEAYDVAHISGKYTVGVMTVVDDGRAKGSDYRKFSIKSFDGVNDVRALKEILERRLAHAEWPLPRLFVVDGGRAQKNAAEKVLKEAGVFIPVVGVVKDERHKPKEVIGKREWVQKYEKDILLANAEAHRFAVMYHKQLRDKIPQYR